MQCEAVRFELPGITLTGVACGSGPVALLYHGITANGWVFQPVIERLAHRFRAISLDQRGHGGSDKPAGGYRSVDFAADIAALIAHLDCGPALLVGHSLGARNALVAGLRRPDQIAGVVAIDFTPYIETQVLDDLEARVNGGDRVFADGLAVKTYLADRYKRLPPDAIERRALHGYAPAPGGLRPLADPRAMSQTANGLREDLEPVLRGITVPVLMMRGADSALVSRDAWNRSRALRPDIAAIEFQRADHYVPEEVPEAVVAEIDRFWMSTRREK